MNRRLLASTTLRSSGGFGGSCSCRTSIAASFDHLVSPGEKRLRDGALGIDQVTLGRWKTRHKEFRSVIEHGKNQADAEIAESLFSRARGYRHEATNIFTPAGSEAPVHAPYVKHDPPDTNAALAWLSRRQPGKWRDRQEVNVTGTVAHRLAQMTPDERAAFALDLAEQARQRLIDAGVIIEREPEPAPRGTEGTGSGQLR